MFDPFKFPSVDNRILPTFVCNLDKTPATPRGFYDATLDPCTLRTQIGDRKDFLLGVPTGELSDLDVLDLDPPLGLDWLARHHNDIPKTRTHYTRRAGLHLLFRHKHGLRCSASKIALGVDIRAEGGYIIWWPNHGLSVDNPNLVADWPSDLLVQASMPTPAPPMAVPDRHIINVPKKKWYNWEDCQKILAPSDSDNVIITELYNTILYQGICRSGTAIDRDFVVRKFSRESRYAVQVAAQTWRELSVVWPGERNDLLNKKSYTAGRLMSKLWTNPKNFIRALWRGAVDNNLVRDDGMRSVTSTIESGIIAGLQNPYPDLD